MKKILLTVICTLLSTMSWAQGSRQLIIQSTGGGEVSITALGTTKTVRESTESWTVTDQIAMSGYLTASLMFTPDNNYTLKSVIVNENYDVTQYVSEGAMTVATQANTTTGGIDYIISNSYTISGIVGDVQIAATFEQTTSSAVRVMIMSYGNDDASGAIYGRTYCQQSGITDGYGPFDGAFDFEVASGTDVSVTFAPEDGCQIDSVILRITGDTADQVLNVTSQVSDNTYVIENVTNQTFLQVYYGVASTGEAEPYAALSDNNTVLTFYYDEYKANRGGMSVGPFNPTNYSGGDDTVEGRPWNDYIKDISTVIFDASFADCSTLTSTKHWFNGFSNLTTIVDISNLNTENVSNMSWMFANCSNLTNIDVSGFRTGNVRNMEVLFGGCSNLESIDVSNFNTENVLEMYAMFSGCSKLTSIDLSSFNTQNLTNIHSMFSGCTALTDLKLGQFNTSNVDYMYNVFGGCSSLTSLDLSTFNTEKVYDMTGMFDGCSSLTSLNVSSFNTSNVVNMRYMFWNCSSLTRLDISSFTTIKVSDMFHMFDGCSNMNTIYVGDGWTVDAVTSGADMFNGCTALVGGAGTTYDADHTDYTYAHIDGGTANPGYFTDQNATTLKCANVQMSQVGNQVTLTTDTEGATINYISGAKNYVYSGTMTVTETQDAFYAWATKDGYLPSDTLTFDPYGVNDSIIVATTEGVLMTFRITGLAERTCAVGASGIAGSTSPCCVDPQTSGVVTIPTMANEFTVTEIDVNAFANCVNITEIVVPEGVTRIGNYAFKDCSGLTIISLPSTLTLLGESALRDCSALKSITIPASLTDIEQYALTGCSSLESIVVESGNTEFDSRESCNAIIGTSSNTLVHGCNNTVIPSTVTRIMDYAFMNCTGLTNITLPAGLTDIFEYAFAGCTNLTTITAEMETPPTIEENVFATYDATLFVPSASLNSYQLKAPWGQFTTIKAIGSDNVWSVIGTINGEWDTDTDMTSTDGVNYTATIPYLAPGTYLYKIRFNHDWTENYGLNGEAGGQNISVTVDEELSSVAINFNVETKVITHSVVAPVYSITGSLAYDDGSPAPGWLEWANDADMTKDANGIYSVTLDNMAVGNYVYKVRVNHDWTYNWGLNGQADGQNIPLTVSEAGSVTIYFNAETKLTSTTYPIDTTVVVDEPYAVLSDNNTVLTFYYDDQKAAYREAMSVGPFDYSTGRGWDGESGNITSVVFDDSFANYTTLSSTAFWFQGCERLTTITGISNLKTDNVTDMRYMFYHCSSLTGLDVSNFSTANVATMRYMFGASGLTALDISNFNTANVTDMNSMFIECSNLTTIYAGSLWSTAGVMDGNRMFTDCTSLVGGAGTTFSADHTDYTYAHIDGGTANPGYFTDPNAPTEKVAAPAFAWSGQSLSMSSATEGATIYYSTTATDDNGDFREPLDPQTLYQQAVTIRENCTIAARATMDDMLPSDTVVLYYPYTAWRALEQAIADAQSVLSSSADNENVTEQQRTALSNMISAATASYEARTDTLAVINQLAAELTTQTESVRQAIEAVDEPYAVLSDNNTVLTFYYDKQKTARGGMSVGPFDYDSSREWNDYVSSITSVVFDDSFAGFTSLTSTRYWFYGLENLVMITGLANLNTASVTDMNYMFRNCSSLTSLDLSSFSTANVTTMNGMFRGCSGLTNLNLSGFNTEKVSNIGYMFSSCSSLTSLDVNGFNTENVTLMNNLFEDCSSLTELNLTSFNTANVTDISRMFMNCSSLTSLDLSGFNTSNVTSMESLFYGCNNLTSVNLDGVTTANVLDMGAMFYNCRSLTSLDVTGFNTEKVTNMSSMFWACSRLTSLDLSSFNTSNVTMMQQMFANCSGLNTIYASSEWSIASVTSGEQMFFLCESLKGGAGTVFSENHMDYTYAHIDGGTANPGYLTDKNAPVSVSAPVFAFDGDNLTMTTETANASIFYNVADLESMDEAYVNSVKNSMTVVPDASYSSFYDNPVELTRAAVVKAIAVLDSQNGLVASDTTTFVYDYDSWHTLLSAIEGGLQVYAEAMNNSNVSSDLLEQLKWALEEGEMMYRQRAEMPSYPAQNFTAQIEELCIQIRAQMNAVDEPYAVLSDNNTVLTFYYDKQKTARGGIDINNSYIDNNSVSPYGSATTAVFDASFADYRPTSTAYWFMGCSSLNSITGMQYLNTSNVTNMRIMFQNCSSLTSLDVSHFNTANVTDVTQMFYGCSGLTNLDVSHFNTTKMTTMYNMFAGCSSLTSLDVTNFDTQNVTDMGAMFSDCTSLTNLDVTNFNTQNATSMHRMFANCSSLTSLDVTNFNTQNVTSMQAMFSGCSGLTSLDLTNFNTAKVKDVISMFQGCSNLTTIYAGSEWSTDAVTESNNMFYRCTNLKGGAGTVYDASHTNHTYAHIDGGTANPGYFTDKNAPTEKVATPTFSWRNDELTMSCTTEGAAIMYQMSDEDVDGDGVITVVDYKEYGKPIVVQRDVIIKAIGIKEGMATSDTITLDYPYLAWYKLYEICAYGAEILNRASKSSRVPQSTREQGEVYIDYALDMYARRTETKDRVESVTADIAILLNEIEQMMNIPSTYTNNVLTVGGDATLAEAIDKHGNYVTNNAAAIVWESSVPLTESELQRMTNPNLLIYAQSESLVPSNRNNVVINGVAKNVVLTDAASDYSKFYAPQQFTAEAIQYTRTFSQQTQIGVSRGWETIALPFTVQTITHAERGQIAPFGNSASTTHFWLRQLTENGLQDAQTIEANEPYIISMPNSEEYRPETNLAGQVTFSALNATVPVTAPISRQYGSVTLVANFQTVYARDEIYTLNVGEERGGHPEGSVFEQNYRSAYPFQCYTYHLDSSHPAPRFIQLNSLGGGNATGIEELTGRQTEAGKADWYTIDGRKLQGAPVTKGMYIKNGKKVIVK